MLYSSAIYVQGIAVAISHRQCGVAKAICNHIEMLAVGLHLPALQVKIIQEMGNVEIFKLLGFHVIEERTSNRFVGLQGQPVAEVTLERGGVTSL